MSHIGKAVFSPLFAVLWFFIVCLGVVLLIVPQLTVNAYGKNKDYIGKWMAFMEAIFEFFKEF
jgi:uncharacterized membrane protein